MGGFDDEYNKSLKRVRNLLDKKLKETFPAYQEKMKEVAGLVGLQKEASKKFGDPQRILNKLEGIHKTTGEIDRKLLKDLGEATGKDFVSGPNEYMRIKKILASPIELEKLRKSLPEYNAHKAAKKAFENAKKQKAPHVINEKIRHSPEYKQLKAASNDVEKLKDVKDQIRGWSEATLENKVSAVMRGKDFVRKQLKYLGKLSNQDFVSLVDDLRVSEAFEQEFRIGS